VTSPDSDERQFHFSIGNLLELIFYANMLNKMNTIDGQSNAGENQESGDEKPKFGRDRIGCFIHEKSAYWGG